MPFYILCNIDLLVIISNQFLFVFYSSGCMDDRGTQHLIGQQFVTTDCRQCFCGNGGYISCDQSQCESSNGGKLNILWYVLISCNWATLTKS